MFDFFRLINAFRNTFFQLSHKSRDEAFRLTIKTVKLIGIALVLNVISIIGSQNFGAITIPEIFNSIANIIGIDLPVSFKENLMEYTIIISVTLAVVLEVSTIEIFKDFGRGIVEFLLMLGIGTLQIYTMYMGALLIFQKSYVPDTIRQEKKSLEIRVHNEEEYLNKLKHKLEDIVLRNKIAKEDKFVYKDTALLIEYKKQLQDVDREISRVNNDFDLKIKHKADYYLVDVDEFKRKYKTMYSIMRKSNEDKIKNLTLKKSKIEAKIAKEKNRKVELSKTEVIAKFNKLIQEEEKSLSKLKKQKENIELKIKQLEEEAYNNFNHKLTIIFAIGLLFIQALLATKVNKTIQTLYDLKEKDERNRKARELYYKRKENSIKGSEEDQQNSVLDFMVSYYKLNEILPTNKEIMDSLKIGKQKLLNLKKDLEGKYYVRDGNLVKPTKEFLKLVEDIA